MSLQEQKDAIARYAQRFSLEITQWFEERETAAKRGRPVFTQMLRLLRQKKARGVIIHKNVWILTNPDGLGGTPTWTQRPSVPTCRAATASEYFSQPKRKI